MSSSLVYSQAENKIPLKSKDDVEKFIDDLFSNYGGSIQKNKKNDTLLIFTESINGSSEYEGVINTIKDHVESIKSNLRIFKKDDEKVKEDDETKKISIEHLKNTEEAVSKIKSTAVHLKSAMLKISDAEQVLGIEIKELISKILSLEENVKSLKKAINKKDTADIKTENGKVYSVGAELLTMMSKAQKNIIKWKTDTGTVEGSNEIHTLTREKGSFKLEITGTGPEKPYIIHSASEKIKNLTKDHVEVEGVSPFKKSVIVYTYEKGSAKRKDVKRYFNNKWRYQNGYKRVFIEASQQLNFSKLLLIPNNFNHTTATTLEYRLKNETLALTIPPVLRIGFAMGSHRISASGRISRYSVNFQDSTSLDYASGLYDNVQQTDRLDLNMRELGLHYSYANYYNRFSPYLGFGVNVSWLKNTESFNYLGVAAMASIGLNYKPCYLFELHLAPTVNYSLRSIKGDNISSRPFSVGFELGACINIPIRSKK